VETRITPQEFRALDLPKNRVWELHEGEIVEMTFPTWIHREIQQRLVRLLEDLLAANVWMVMMEMPFEAGDNDRSADVGVIRRDRREPAAAGGVLLGAPDIVIEVHSPTDRKRELIAYRKLCFDYGTRLFVHVRPDERLVVITRADQMDRTVTFEANDQVPLEPVSSANIPVTAIFEGIVPAQPEQ
jgi:Uma2 family endonuclease